VVGLLVVGESVPIWGIIGTGHPTTRQTQAQPGPVVPAGQAVQTAGRVRLNLVGSFDMPTPAPVGTTRTLATSSRHHAPFPPVHYPGGGHHESTAPANPGKQPKQARLITRADSRAQVGDRVADGPDPAMQALRATEVAFGVPTRSGQGG
jgi:hypothetical protein